MTKKALTIIVSAILTITLFGLVGYYFYTNKEQNPAEVVVNTFKNFFPFGGETNNNQENNENQEQNNENQEQTPEVVVEFTKKLRKISTEAVSGAGVLDIKAGSVVRYIEKATGHVYEVELFSPKQNRISNTTIPLSYDAVWGNKNTSFIARYLKEDNNNVDTYSMTIKNVSTSTENTLTGTAFPGKITDISVFGGNVFYIQTNTTGSVGVISAFDGTKKKEIWNSPIKNITSQYINDKTVLINTKPLEGVNGFLYSINTTTGAINKILGGVPGLVSLSNSDMSKVIYLSQTTTAMLFVFDTKTKTYTELYPATFPEKCVWSNKDKTIVYCAVPKTIIDGGSLSSWYKGLVTFSDDVWKFNTKDSTSSMVGDIQTESGENIDVIKPILSENEQYFIFINKKDNSLWSLDLTK